MLALKNYAVNNIEYACYCVHTSLTSTGTSAYFPTEDHAHVWHTPRATSPLRAHPYPTWKKLARDQGPCGMLSVMHTPAGEACPACLLVWQQFNGTHDFLKCRLRRDDFKAQAYLTSCKDDISDHLCGLLWALLLRTLILVPTMSHFSKVGYHMKLRMTTSWYHNTQFQCNAAWVPPRLGQGCFAPAHT